MGASYSKKSQEGKVILITGANSGIGYDTALELGKLGAHVICLCRDKDRGTKAVSDMQAAAPEGKFELELLNVSNLTDVKDFAMRLEKRTDIACVDTLINNAGIMMLPTRVLSPDGFEMQWATNVLGHFALTGLLLPQLVKSEDPRVVNLASLAAWSGRKGSFHDFRKDTDYDGSKVYGDTKLANLMFTAELAKRYPGLTVTAAHPGITSTNLTREISAFGQWWGKTFFQNSASGALPTLRAATDGAVNSGDYFGPRFSSSGLGTYAYWPPYAKDVSKNASLWAACATATGVDYLESVLQSPKQEKN